MYDSRSDHARKPKSPVARARTLDETLDDEWTGRIKGRSRVTLTAKQVIAEHLAPDPVTLDYPGLKRMHVYYVGGWAQWSCEGGHGLALWECQILGGDCERETAEVESYADRLERYLDEQLREAEAMDRDDDEDVRIGPARIESTEPEPGEEESNFLPLLSMTDAYHELGDDGWHIEGPKVERDEPLKGEHYVRVHVLANEVGLTSKALIRHLCLSGEHVANHMSMVALPVADRVRCDFPAPTVAEVKPDAKARLDDLRERLGRPPAPRPGGARLPESYRAPRPIAPRPGNNPFAIR